MDIQLAWNASTQQGDLVVASGDLVLDGTLASAVTISLASDRLANADDDLAFAAGGNGPDRRGWWGDMPIDPTVPLSAPDHIGARLWLLRRAKATQDVLPRAEGMIREALQWMLDDGVAARIDVAPALSGTMLQAAIAIYQQSSAGNAAPAYATLWAMSLGGGV